MADLRSTLLVVDDDPDVLDVLVKTFERLCNVLTAADGFEALQILRNHKVDLLLTDQRMPEMTGIDLLAKARADGIDVTAILMTGYTDPREVIAAINKGQVFRFVTKPFDINDLRLTVTNALEVTQLRRDNDRLIRQLNKRVEALSVLFEVSHQSAGGVPTYDAIVDRVMTAVSRVLPCDAGAALVVSNDGQSASLRIHSTGTVGEKGLLWAQEEVLSQYRQQSGLALPNESVMTQVHGTTADSPSLPNAFASQLTVSLLALGKPMGILSLFSHQVNAYSAEDGELLDILANQTADAILALRAAESESQRQIERMVESMADGVLLIDPNNQTVVINPAARRMLRLLDGSGEESARQIRQTLGFHPFEWILASEYSGAKMLRDEIHVEDRTLQFALTPVSDSRGTVKGVCIVLRDITEQKQLEERKEEFVSIVSHELRTPLTSISGALDLILNFMVGDVSEKQQRYLALAKESADKLNSIVDDLLDLSKFAKGRLQMNFELVALDGLLRAAVERYTPSVMEKKIRVDLQLPDKSVRVLADPNRMTQVFHNLFTNAVKFTPDGGDIVIRLGSSPHLPGFVCLACYNSGEGIPEEDLERVFDKFEQARSERTRTVRGTGLGLPISRNIVDAHGGQIWAEENRSGAELVMVLPIKPPDEVLESEGFDPSAQRVASLRGTVLLRLDDVQLTYLLKGVLGRRGYRVIATGDVNAALEKWGKARPDVAFVDIASAEQLFGAEAPPCPLVVISEPFDRERVFALGASAFLKKPIGVDQLFATADSLLKGMSKPKRGRVVVIDDDEQVIALCREVLPNLGFQLLAASSVQSGRALLQERRPDLLLLNLALEEGRSLELLEELEVERAAGCISVIGISNPMEGSTKGRAFVSGVDDSLVKPFDAEELMANVQAVIRSREGEGAGAIEAEVKRRLELGLPFAFCYLELDGLKAYGDYYGFAKADGVVKQTGNLLREVVAQVGGAGDFLGHVTGSNFVLIADPDRLDALCRRATLAFNRVIPLYYDKEDRERGYIEVDDKWGHREQSAIIGLSIVAVISDGRTTTHADLARHVSELKRQAKSEGGSSYWRSDRQWPIRWTLESITGS